jgi:hypothetical protein
MLPNRSGHVPAQAHRAGVSAPSSRRSRMPTRVLVRSGVSTSRKNIVIASCPHRRWRALSSGGSANAHRAGPQWPATFDFSLPGEPIGQFLRRIPRRRGPARILIYTFDEIGIIQSQQNRIKPVHNLLHESAHFVIADARQSIPSYIAIRCNDLRIGKVARLRARSVNILDACVAHAQDGYAQRQPLCYFFVHLGPNRKNMPPCFIGSKCDPARAIKNDCSTPPRARSNVPAALREVTTHLHGPSSTTQYKVHRGRNLSLQPRPQPSRGVDFLERAVIESDDLFA